MRKQRKTALEQDLEQMMGEYLGMINPIFVQRLADYINANYSKRRAHATPPAETKVASKHPAIAAFRTVTNRFPHKALWDKIVEVVGETPDVEAMQVCWKTWLDMGKNPMATTWLTDWYGFYLKHKRIPTFLESQKTARNVVTQERAQQAETIEELIYGK